MKRTLPDERKGIFEILRICLLIDAEGDPQGPGRTNAGDKKAGPRKPGPEKAKGRWEFIPRPGAEA